MEHATTQNKIIFFGTPEFAVPALEALHGAGYDIAAVVTQPDKPVGRGLKMEAPAVKKKAEELGLKVLQPPSLKDADHVVRGFILAQSEPKGSHYTPTLGIAVAYGKIIPKSVLDLFPRGILNIHPSLLPKYRGPSPIQAAILNGDEDTGVTIMLLDEEMDQGAILAQNPHLISPLERGRKRGLTGDELSKILAQEGAKLLVKTLPKWLSGAIAPQPQDHTKATYTKLLTREDGRIHWKKPAEYIERMARAYDPWPGTWTVWPAQISASQKLQSGKLLKIIRASTLHPQIGCASNSTPGFVWLTDDGRLAINCNPGSVILEQLQLQGKKQMSGREFLRGHSLFLFSVL